MEKSINQQREKIVKAITNKRGSSKLKLNKNELKIYERLKKIVAELKDNADLNILTNLFDLKEKLRQTELYSILKKMPKGVINHLHLPAAFSLETFQKICMDDRVCINQKTHSLKIFLPTEKPEEDFVRIKDFAKEVGKSRLDEIFKNNLLLTKDEFLKHSDNSIFQNFGKKFDFMMVMYYEPFFELLFEDIVRMVEKDNVQGVELRHVFNFNLTKDNKLQSKKGELDFFKRMLEKSTKSHPDLKISLLVTSVKVMGKDHFKESLEFYRNSLDSHPELLRGFDMVHYEDSVMIRDFEKELLELKEKDKRVKYYFHAGETLNPDNNNVMDSVLLGTERIGHGLAIQTSPLLIDLVRKNNICVETNPLSNYLLGYVRDLRWHPAKFLINCGVKISINPDDYLIFGEDGSSMDFLLAFLYWDFDLRDIKWCIYNSIDYSSFNPEEKNSIKKNFNAKWNQFIEENQI